MRVGVISEERAHRQYAFCIDRQRTLLVTQFIIQPGVVAYGADIRPGVDTAKARNPAYGQRLYEWCR